MIMGGRVQDFPIPVIFSSGPGAHSQASDGAELPFVFAKLALAPEFTGKQPPSRDGSE